MATVFSVIQLLDTAGAGSISDTYNFQRNRDEAGIFQVDYTGDPTIETVLIRLQGRAVPNSGWVEITTIASIDLITSAGSGFKTFKVFPQMRARVINLSSGTVNVWVVP